MTVGFTIFSKGYFFGSNGGVLVSQLRKLSLQAMLRQVYSTYISFSMTHSYLYYRKLGGLI